MKLKSLDEHDAGRVKAFADFIGPQPNGIACPKCGAECVDIDTSVVLASYPPRAMIACSRQECDFSGSRVC